MDDLPRQQNQYNKTKRTDTKPHISKTIPIVVLLVFAGIAAYAFNVGGFRTANRVAPVTKSNSHAQPSTNCPTLFNGPHSVLEDGRLRYITPTLHPCQYEEFQITPMLSPTTSPTPFPHLTQ